MKIEILGSGNAFESSLGTTSFLLWNDDETDAVLMDCGYSVFTTLREMESSGRDIISKIKTVFISHLHDDHVGSAGTLAFFRKAVLSRLNREIETTRFIGVDISPLFNLVMQGSQNIYEYDNNQTDFKLIKTFHGYEIPTCGILLNGVIYSGDTCKHILDTDYAKQAKIIIHEATLNENTPYHTNFNDLLLAPAEIKAKTWLIHNSKKHLEFGFEQIALDNGFAGICKKGQIIEID